MHPTTADKIAKNERIIESFVSKNVIHCASYMVSELASYDWELVEPVTINRRQDEIDDLVDELEGLERELNMLDACDFITILDYKRECARIEKRTEQIKHEIEDLEQGEEALEHWIVTPDLARKLEEHGEMVSDIFDFWIWGRTCSGQAIASDCVMHRICSEMEILAGQEYEWDC